MNVYLLTLLLAAAIALGATVLLRALSTTRLLSGPFGQNAAHRPRLGRPRATRAAVMAISRVTAARNSQAPGSAACKDSLAGSHQRIKASR